MREWGMRLGPIGRPHMEERFGGWEWVGETLHTMIIVERAFAVDSALHVLLMYPL